MGSHPFGTVYARQTEWRGTCSTRRQQWVRFPRRARKPGESGFDPRRTRGTGAKCGRTHAWPWRVKRVLEPAPALKAVCALGHGVRFVRSPPCTFRRASAAGGRDARVTSGISILAWGTCCQLTMEGDGGRSSTRFENGVSPARGLGFDTSAFRSIGALRDQKSSGLLNRGPPSGGVGATPTCSSMRDWLEPDRRPRAKGDHPGAVPGSRSKLHEVRTIVVSGCTPACQVGGVGSTPTWCSKVGNQIRDGAPWLGGTGGNVWCRLGATGRADILLYAPAAYPCSRGVDGDTSVSQSEVPGPIPGGGSVSRGWPIG